MKKIKIHLDKKVSQELDSKVTGELTGKLSKQRPIEPLNVNYLLSSDSPAELEKKHEQMLDAKLKSLRELSKSKNSESE